MGSGKSASPPAFQELEPRVHLTGTHFVHTTAALSQARGIAGATTIGDLAMFAGGTLELGVSHVVDVYNARADAWSTAKLSTARYQIGATTVAAKALFAGGTNGIVPDSAVDIYDNTTGMWSTAKLSQGNTPSASVTVGTKALFVGGQDLPSSHVEIYDASKDRWSITNLSQARAYPAGTVVGTTAFFAGGYLQNNEFSDVVDIYDGTAGRWSTMKLPVAAKFDAATTVGSKAIFAGGTIISKHGQLVYGSDLVEIFDTRTGRWSTAKLSKGRGLLAALSVGNVALFAGGEYDDRHGTHASNVVDVYDAKTGQWSTTTLAQARAGVAGTAVGDTAIFAGGFDPMDISDRSRDTVDLFTLDAALPVPRVVSAPTIDRSLKTCTFTISYHDRNGIDRSTFDDNDIFVTGPNGFNHAAHFLSEAPGKHASTRVVTYALHGRGLRWDAGENGLYTIRLHGNQVTDTAGNAANGDDLGKFTVAIPASLSSSTVRVQFSKSTSPAKGKVDNLDLFS
jgi:hypothetical protein